MVNLHLKFQASKYSFFSDFGSMSHKLLGVSTRTIRRRMNDGGIRMRHLYSQVSDSTLDQLIGSLVQQHPNAGYRMMQAYLCSQGVRVQEARVRGELIPQGL